MTSVTIAPWLAQSRWPTVPIRLVARLGSGHTPSRTVATYWEDCTIPWVTLADVWQLRSGTASVISNTKEKISALGLAGSAAVKHPAGTVILSRTASVGFSAILATDMATSQDFATWTCGPRLDPRFLLHALRGMAPDLKRIAIGSTHKTIYMPDIEQLRVPLPPLQEQRRIADFLDCEVGKINVLIAKKLELVSLLDERINSRILGHVGASQIVNSKSGLPVSPIRHIMSKVSRPRVLNGEMITAFRNGQVTARSIRRAEGYTLSLDEGAQGQGVEVDDIVVHGLDGFSGAIGTSEMEGNCSPVYHVCVPRKDGDPIFLGRLLRVLAVGNYLGLFAISTRERAVDFRNWDLFGRIPVPDIPFQEQVEISHWIRATRPLRIAVERSNALATERRQALITAAVTGQFDVTTAREADLS
jgi:type I restriction enzyme, S subunit